MFKRLKLSLMMLTFMSTFVVYSFEYPQKTPANSQISNGMVFQTSTSLPQTAPYPLTMSTSARLLIDSTSTYVTAFLLQLNRGNVVETGVNSFPFPLMAQQPVLPSSELKPQNVSITSINELMLLFDSLDYTLENFHKGNKSIPRLTFDAVGEGWRSVSSQLPVKQKKTVFFRLMTPLVLLANEKILQERQVIMSADIDDTALIALAVKYKVLSSTDKPLLEAQRQMLLKRVDILPPSLVLAQAAKESGWGTSRFSHEGNALFGQWDFNGDGMEPKQKRQGLGNYGLARFDTPLASVEGYLLNLNTHNAYQKMRDLRVQSRQDNQAVTGSELAGTLDRYSERGHAYVEAIRQMIRTNKLYLVDDTYLSDDAPLHLLTRTN
ncbi:glucosaminidase domain-containing protein [Shewanella sp. SP1S2-4]|uniref:glucosaminidase domain-containing protein n=1 Tax=Shewanella sp. SP1S2-4 TaxID=3063537 RepID=UPI00288E1DA3|nr:glucosaminidase domain-containing protein [Shewanella sp. SP1S2-4]MDT3320145.1 glucosaminidase domain-containing protein [Shewanella sp. SP1S2-4]